MCCLDFIWHVLVDFRMVVLMILSLLELVRNYVIPLERYTFVACIPTYNFKFPVLAKYTIPNPFNQVW